MNTFALGSLFITDLVCRPSSPSQLFETSSGAVYPMNACTWLPKALLGFVRRASKSTLWKDKISTQPKPGFWEYTAVIFKTFTNWEPSDQKPSLQKSFLWQRGGSPEWILILLREMPGKSRHTYSLQTYIRDKLWEMQKGCMFVGYHGDECSIRA